MESPSLPCFHRQGGPFYPKGERSNMRNDKSLSVTQDRTRLIELAKAGDQLAFESLLDSYAPLIDSMTGRFSAPTSSVQDREDLRQEALIAFYRALVHFDTAQSEVKFGLYAKECIRNRLISYLRSQKRHENVVFLADDPADEKQPEADEDPARLLIEEESYLALSRRIHDALSEYENRIWWLYLSGRTASEIAQQVGTQEKSVQNAIYRIRKKLRAVIPYS